MLLPYYVPIIQTLPGIVHCNPAKPGSVGQYPVNYLLQEWVIDAGIRSDKLAIVDGSVSFDDRKVIVDSFNDKKISCIFATVGTFDVGINIPGASICILMQPTWNWADMAQAYNRMIRPKSTGTRQVEILTLDNSIEKYVRRLYEMKRVNSDYVIDHGPRPPEVEWSGWTEAVEQMFADMVKGEFTGGD